MASIDSATGGNPMTVQVYNAPGQPCDEYHGITRWRVGDIGTLHLYDDSKNHPLMASYAPGFWGRIVTA